MMRKGLLAGLLKLIKGLTLLALAYQQAQAEAPKPSQQFNDVMSRGKSIYQTYCATCHQENGGGTILQAPALKKGLYSSSYLTTDKLISRNIDLVLFGVAGTEMIPYKQVLSNEQLAEVITYIRNAWGNNSGDLVTPEQIQQRKERLAALHELEQKDDYSIEQLMQAGQVYYRAYCARCHQLDGKGKAPYGPKLKGSYLASLTELIPYKIDLLLTGAKGTRMRSYSNQLSDFELAAVLTYIANAWENQGNQLIQPGLIEKEKLRLQKLAGGKNVPDTQNYRLEELMPPGRIAYMAYCARCHLPDGGGGAQPGVVPLRGSALITKGEISAHIDLVLLGVPGSIMRTFAPRLTDFELAAILTYERNAWGNKTNQVVQPMDVMQRRKKLQKAIDFQTENQLIQQFLKEQDAAWEKDFPKYKF